MLKFPLFAGVVVFFFVVPPHILCKLHWFEPKSSMTTTAETTTASIQSDNFHSPRIKVPHRHNWQKLVMLLLYQRYLCNYIQQHNSNECTSPCILYKCTLYKTIKYAHMQMFKHRIKAHNRTRLPWFVLDACVCNVHSVFVLHCSAMLCTTFCILCTQNTGWLLLWLRTEMIKKICNSFMYFVCLFIFRMPAGCMYALLSIYVVNCEWKFEKDPLD